MRANRVSLYLSIILIFPFIILGFVFISRQSSDDPSQWKFFRAFPLKWEGPSENASSSSSDVVEMVFATESVELDVSEATPTATLNIVATSSPTPEFVSAVADQDARCRYGPNTIFHVIGYLQRGEVGIVQARSSLGDWYLISIQSRGISCWVWKDLLLVEGNVSSLPVNPGPAPPTKVPTEPPEVSKRVGCWVENDPQYPNGICKPALCGPNDFPATDCDLP